MKTKVGECCVDSGQILICDPTYVREDDCGPLPARPARGSTWSYANAVALTCGARDSHVLVPGHGQMTNEHGAPLGYVSATGGDGRFPVYAELDEHGHVVALEIRFDE